MSGAEIVIKRRAEGRGDRLRIYTVVLDGKKVAQIGRGESVTVETGTGHHELHLTIDWARSQSLEFDLRDGQQLDVDCWPNANPTAWPYWLTFGRSNYIGISTGGMAAGSVTPPRLRQVFAGLSLLLGVVFLGTAGVDFVVNGHSRGATGFISGLLLAGYGLRDLARFRRGGA